MSLEFFCFPVFSVAVKSTILLIPDFLYVIGFFSLKFYRIISLPLVF